MRPEALLTIKWECIQFIPATTSLPHDAALRSLGIHLATIDGASISTKRGLFEALQAALQFPDYFGFNWDAVNECLRDLNSWIPAPAYLLRIDGGIHLWKTAPELAGALVESWLSCAESWADQAVPFRLWFMM